MKRERKNEGVMDENGGEAYLSVVGGRGRRRRGARVVDDGRRRGDVGRRLRTPGRRHARPGPHVLLRRAHRRRRRLMAMMSTAGLRLVRHLPAVRLHQICAPTLSADGRRRVVASAVRRMNDVNDLFSFKMELSEHKSPISKLAFGVGVVVSAVLRMNEVNNTRRARLVLEWVIVFGRVYHLGISVCKKPTRSTQPRIPLGSLSRVPASSGVREGET